MKRLLFLVLMLGLIFAANADAALRINTPEGFVGRNSPVFTLNTTGGDTYGLRDKPGYAHAGVLASRVPPARSQSRCLRPSTTSMIPRESGWWAST